MRRVLVASALTLALAACGPASAPKPPEPAKNEPAPAPPAASATNATVIADPKAFVTEVYEKLAANNGYAPPTDIYTPHLASLWQVMEHGAGGEVGRIDFEFWTNAQEWDLKDIVVSEQPVEGADSRRLVVARFTNLDRPEEIRFYFEKAGDRWLLDDARSTGKDHWTLSLILKYGWDDSPA